MICLHVKEIYNTIMVLQLHPALLKTIRQMKYARWWQRRSFFVSRTLWACGLSFYRTNLDWPPEKKMQDNHYTAGINSVMLNLERYHPRLHSMYCTIQPKNKNKFAKNSNSRMRYMQYYIFYKLCSSIQIACKRNNDLYISTGILNILVHICLFNNSVRLDF